MAWKEAFGVLEETIIGTYDLGRLDIDMLATLIKPHHPKDILHPKGSCSSLESRDRKLMEEVVVEVGGKSVTCWPRPSRIINDELRGKLARNEPLTIDEANLMEAWSRYRYDLYEAFTTIVKRYCGWKEVQ